MLILTTRFVVVVAAAAVLVVAAAVVVVTVVAAVVVIVDAASVAALLLLSLLLLSVVVVAAVCSCELFKVCTPVTVAERTRGFRLIRRGPWPLSPAFRGKGEGKNTLKSKLGFEPATCRPRSQCSVLMTELYSSSR